MDLRVRTDRSFNAMAAGSLSPASPPASSPLHHAPSLSQGSLRDMPINPLPLPPRVRPTPLRQRKLQDYLKSLNSMTRSIVLETETLAHEHLRDWVDMNDARKEEVVNDHFIPTGVRAQYERAHYVNIDTLLASRGSAPFLPQHECSAAVETGADLTTRNHTAALSMEEYSLSQPAYYSDPSLDHRETPASSTGFTQCYRLHKKQLSFRPNSVHPHNDLHTPPQRSQSRPNASLGSDGERVSDEESSPLAFRRNRFRSYSMRPKKGSGRGMRGSNRSAHKVHRPTTPDVNASRRTTGNEARKQPSPLEDSSVPVYEGDIDIDLPIDLNVSDEPINHSTPTTTPPRFSRSRKSQRQRPSVAVQDDCGNDADAESETGVVMHDRYTSVDSGHPDSPSADTSSSSLPVAFSIGATVPKHTDADQESLDCVSIATSLDLLEGRTTPDSILSMSSNLSYRPRSRKEEVTVLRNPRGKRGGSSYRTATSEFADRHAQFKSNMLRKYRSPDTREGTPVSSTPVPLDEDCLSQDFKPPTHSLAQHHSMVSSPPTTPLVQSLLKAHVFDSQRESGYISSSSDSFAFRRY